LAGLTIAGFLAPPATGSAIAGTPTAVARTRQQDQQKDADKEKKGDQKKKKKEGDDQEEGTLENFESETTADNPDSVSSGGSDGSTSLGFFGDVAVFALFGGAVGSWYRATGHPQDNDLQRLFGHRRTGDAGVPFVGLNLSYQNVKSDVEAYDLNAEAGFGPLAAHYRLTRFHEDDPDTDLDLQWLHGVLRLSYTKYFELGLGVGALLFHGKSRESGGSFALPIRIEPVRYCGLDYRPTWGWINGNTLSDHDLAIRIGVQYVSVRAGYRWTKVGDATLEGPIFGLLFSY